MNHIRTSGGTADWEFQNGLLASFLISCLAKNCRGMRLRHLRLSWGDRKPRPEFLQKKGLRELRSGQRIISITSSVSYSLGLGSNTA